MVSTIILEGPDGAGKTTLRDRMIRDIGVEPGPRASTSLGGPVPDLLNWVEEDQEQWLGSAMVRLYDRYPLISEQVYGPVLRDAPQYPFGSAIGKRHMDKMMGDSLVIWCMPPLETVVSNIAADEDGQMPGVRENITDIYTAYEAVMNAYTGKALRYDYTDYNETQTDQFILGVALAVSFSLLQGIVNLGSM